MYRMHTLGAPYTYLAPWREELSNPIHRPILGTVVELRLQALRDGNMSPRKTSNPDSGIGMGEAEGAREQRVTGAGLGIGGWQVEVPEIVIVPASPQRVRLSKGKERIREGCLEVPRVERRNTME
jgi:hypothetical protein